MPKVQIVLSREPTADREGAPLHGIARLKSAGIILLTGLVVIGLLIAVFVVSSVIASVILVLLVLSILVLAIRLIFRLPRRP